MKFSSFINNTINNDNSINWNYYGQSFNASQLLTNDNSKKFIQEYFKNGNKELALFLEPTAARNFITNYFGNGRKDYILNNEFEQKDLLPDNRAIHTISGFFLGLLIENCLNGRSMLRVGELVEMPFSYLWFLTFLYHDYGYCIAENDNSFLSVPRNAPIPRAYNTAHASEYSALRNIKDKLNITTSPFSTYFHRNNSFPNISTYNALIREITIYANRCRTVFCSTGKRINTHRYKSLTITRYFNYRINVHKKVDHGIIAGYMFYDRIIKNYVLSYLANSDMHKRDNLSHFIYKDRVFRQEQIPVFAYIADCIMTHNIWMETEKYSNEYREYMLDELMKDTFRKITYEENPILYILCIADTLEPTKAYAEIPKEIILNSLDIDYTPQSKQIKFSTLSTDIDINVLYKKAKDLEDWTSVKCNRVGDTSFSIEL